MKTPISTGFVGCAALIFVVGSAGAVRGQALDALVKAKALYAEASYDDALRVLSTFESAEAHQYRALCLLALGQVQDAERALEALIGVAPDHAMSESDSPPRLVAMFSQVRRRVLPGVVRGLFAEARENFQAKELNKARGKFETVLALATDPALSGAPDLRDMQLLSASYLDILKSTSPTSPVPAKTNVRAPAVGAPTVSASSSPLPPTARGNAGTSGTARVVPAETIRQHVPSYAPPASAGSEKLSGVVRVVIGADGKVKSASMEDSVHPLYDIRLLAAAKSWLYRPALVDGRPTSSEKLVTVTVGTK
jgi:hypothetical protein